MILKKEGNLKSACFGKLPAFADFVRYNAGSQEALAFDQWVQQGINFARKKLNKEWDRIFINAPSYHFVFSPEKAAHYVVGIIHPSADKSERKFPFVVFTLVSKLKFNQIIPALVPIIFQPFFEKAEELIQQALAGMLYEDMISRLDNIPVPDPSKFHAAEKEYRELLSQTTMESFLSQVWGRADDERKYVLMNNLLELLLPLQRSNPARFSLGLKFPLPSDQKVQALNASFWVKLSQHLTG
ncbi:type VI secretion system-associated protein TagF, partial [candidate division CSSED10-310 bacterium]